MNQSNIIKRSILTLAAIAFAGCAGTEADTGHLEEGTPGVEVMPITWGIGVPTPKKFTVQPGDSVEPMTRTCERNEAGKLPSAGVCRQALDAECNDDGGIPLPDTLMRANFDEERDLVSITVTIKCRFPASDS